VTTLGADLWQLQINDGFGYNTPESIINDANLRAQYLIVDSNGTYLKSTNLNLGRVFKQGIDYDAQWRRPTDLGRLRISLKGTLNLQSKIRDSSNGSYDSDLGKFDSKYYSYTPQHLFMLTMGLEQSGWNAITALNYRSGNTEVANLVNISTGAYSDVFRKVPAFWTIDLGAQWQISHNLTFSSYMANITDRTPPLRLQAASTLNGVDTHYANYYGRTLKLKAEYKF